MTKAPLSLTMSAFTNATEEIVSTLDSVTDPQEDPPIGDRSLLVGDGVSPPALSRERGGRDSHIEICRFVTTLPESAPRSGAFPTILSSAADDTTRNCA